MNMLRNIWNTDPRRDRDSAVYIFMVMFAILFPLFANVVSGGSPSFWLSFMADGGVYMLLALGLNVVVGMAGLLDLGYAAFFAIGAYTYAFLASNHLEVTPLQTSVHIPFWIVLFIALFVAAAFGVILGAPTLRLRGDYLAIVTLGFGEIVPRVFKNAAVWTSGVNGISALDTPQLPFWIQGPWSGDSLGLVTNLKIFDPFGYYVIMCLLLVFAIILVRNLQNSRMGRAWAAIREDEVAAAAMGVNTVQAKLLAFAIGASVSGFAGTFYGAKLSLVSPENFTFIVSITVLVMVVLGGMGNIPGVLSGALLLYWITFWLLPGLPDTATNIANSFGLTSLTHTSGDFPGIGEYINRLKFLVFGLILVVTMLVRPQGLVPSRERQQELTKGTHDDTIIEDVQAEVG